MIIFIVDLSKVLSVTILFARIAVENSDGCGTMKVYRATYMKLMRFVNYDRLKSSVSP